MVFIMSKIAVNETFNALFALTDLRSIYREIKPTFKIDESTKEKIKEIIKNVRKSLESIEKELLK